MPPRCFLLKPGDAATCRAYPAGLQDLLGRLDNNLGSRHSEAYHDERLLALLFGGFNFPAQLPPFWRTQSLYPSFSNEKKPAEAVMLLTVGGNCICDAFGNMHFVASSLQEPNPRFPQQLSRISVFHGPHLVWALINLSCVGGRLGTVNFIKLTVNYSYPVVTDERKECFVRNWLRQDRVIWTSAFQTKSLLKVIWWSSIHNQRLSKGPSFLALTLCRKRSPAGPGI